MPLRTAPLLLVATVLLLGCDRPSADTVALCRSLQRSFSLTGDDRTKCQRDTYYRKELELRRERIYADAITKSHNRDRTILRPRDQELTGFVPIKTMSELPVSFLRFDDAAKTQVGKRYVIDGTVRVLPAVDNTGDVSAFVRGAHDVSREHGIEMVGTLALNSYQKAFLEHHCVLAEGTSLCTGRVYLEIMQDLRSPLIRPQIVGAEFEEGRAQQVLDQLQDTHRRAEQAMRKRKNR